MSAKKILIVEDEGVTALALEVTLNKMGYAPVGIANTGREAVRMALDLKPDVILMDIHIKGDMDGIQATMKINESSDIPVVYLTAYSDDETASQALKTNAHSFLIKPYNPRELYFTIEFVSLRHQLEKQLKASEKKYRDLVTTLHEGICVIDIDVNLSYVNPRMAEMLGYTDEEMQGRAFFDFIDKRERENVQDRFQHWKEGVKEQFESELLKKDGTRINVLIASTPLHEESGKYSGVLAAITDITRTKNRQLEYRNLVQMNTEAMLILNQDYSIVFANPAAENIFGCLSEELSGKPFEYPVIPGELTEIDIPRRNGTIAYGEIRISAITWEGIPSYMVIIRDITERKQMLQKIREGEERNLFYIKEAAMRLKTPIEVVQQNISTVIMDIGSGEYALEEIVPQLLLQVKNMEQIEQNINELNKTILEGFKNISPASKKFLTE